MIQPGDTILFQGDSITDAGRARNVEAPNNPHGLGHGYAQMVAARLLAERPNDDLKIINRGISGNRVTDLYSRWKIGAVNLEPDLISILIGVNDTWHEFNSNNGVELPRYESIYRQMLEYTREKLPEVKLVLCEPFFTRCGQVTPEWEPDLKARQEVVGKLAGEFDAVVVPFQAMFDAACEENEPAYWADDGVHPSPAGHYRMAQCWYDTVIGQG